MQYQAYLVESEKIKTWVDHFKAKLIPFYEELQKLINEVGAKTANLSQYTVINGFVFDVVPAKGWKQVESGLHMPTTKKIKAKLEAVQALAPAYTSVLNILDWKPVSLNGEILKPTMDFIGEDTILRHPLFAHDSGNCFEFFNTEGLKEVTESQVFRLREAHIQAVV